MSKSTLETSLDAILVQVGEFGKYQIYVFILVWIPIIMHSAVHVAYVFTAMDLTYRCQIPECDSGSSEYETSWLINAVPYTDGVPEKCEMYAYNSTEGVSGNCSASEFDRKEITRCTSFVYKTEEKSIVQEYDIHCSDKLWKLTLVGTLNSIGQFSGLFLAGMLSDRYGRRVVMVFGMILCAICGLIRTIMPTYELFLLLEYLDAFFSAGTFLCGFVLAVELVGPKKRVLVGSIACSASAVGAIFTAVTAWSVKYWRSIIYILYTPPFLLLSYLWIVPESIRWNIKKNRIEEAKATLRKLAKVNGKEISEKTLDQINIAGCEESSNQNTHIFQALKSATLFLRFLNACFCWITCSFLYYGLLLNSVTLAKGDKYLNFILTSTVEIPAIFFCNFFMSHLGRRKSLCGFYLITGIACAAFIFIPSEATAGSLSAYLIGKFGATAAFTGIYVFTSEVFPTPMRQSFMGACSTSARIGIMIAPQVPLLASIWNPLPLVCFSSLAFISSCLILLFPETINAKLPDTIEEAENLSKFQKDLKLNDVQTKDVD